MEIIAVYSKNHTKHVHLMDNMQSLCLLTLIACVLHNSASACADS
jgi:hypothetical protein